MNFWKITYMKIKKAHFYRAVLYIVYQLNVIPVRGAKNKGR